VLCDKAEAQNDTNGIRSFGVILVNGGNFGIGIRNLEIFRKSNGTLAAAVRRSLPAPVVIRPEQQANVTIPTSLDDTIIPISTIRHYLTNGLSHTPK